MRSDPAAPLNRGPLMLRYAEREVRVNSIVAACMRWSLDNVTEPRLIVEEDTAEGWQQVKSPGFEALMGAMLGKQTIEYGLTESRSVQQTAWSLNLDGNSYWLAARTESGALLGFMPTNHNYVRPIHDSFNTKITGYQIGNKTYPASDVIHFRRGVDPELAMMGEAPLKSVMRQIMTDNEIAAYQHRVVQSPSPGIMIAVKGNISTEERTRLTDMAKSKFTGERVGEPFIAEGDVTMTSVGWSPADIAIDKLARLPEERITAAFGLPATVVGVGAGLATSTYDNVRANMYAAVINHLDPIWCEIEQTLTLRVLPLVDSTPKRRVRFDRSKVAALNEDQTSKYTRIIAAWEANVFDRQRTLMMLGEPYSNEDAGLFYWMLAPKAQIMPPAKDVGIRSRLANPL